jgi:hypothetical protein
MLLNCLSRALAPLPWLQHGRTSRKGDGWGVSGRLQRGMWCKFDGGFFVEGGAVNEIIKSLEVF